MTKRKFTHPDDAPEGHRWKTRDGQKVTQLTAFDVGCGTDTLAGVIGGGCIVTWGCDGRYATTGADHTFDICDLCDVPVEHTVWVYDFDDHIEVVRRKAGINNGNYKRWGQEPRSITKVTCREGQFDD